MKSQVKNTIAPFQPYTIELTIESPEEAAALYSLFNHSVLMDAIEPGVDRGEIRSLRDDIKAGCDGHKFDAMKYHQRLVSIIN